jgi:hypothetical protein
MVELLPFLNTAMIGYFLNKLGKLEEKVNLLENELILLNAITPKRRDDG